MTPPSPGKRLVRAGGAPRAAFTIIELLVAMTISVIIVVLLAAVISQTMTISHKSGSELQAMNAAAAAIDLIAGDLDSLAVTRQPYEFFQAFDEPAAIGPSGSTITPMRLLMLCNSAEDAATSSTSSGTYSYPDSGLTHAVCYQILYQDPLGGSYNNKIFGLYRTVMSSTNTFTGVMGLSNQYPSPSYWASVSASSAIVNSQSQPAIKTDFIAPNVIDLEVAVDGNVLAHSTPTISSGTTQLLNPAGSAGSPFEAVQLSGTGILTGVAYTSAGSVSTAGGAPSALLLTTRNTIWGSTAAYAEVTVTVLEDEGATLWAYNKTSSTLAKLKLKYGHTLTRKILIRPPQ